MPIEIEDRALAHVKVVVTTKLRRNESFTLSWTHADGTQGGRSAIWIAPAIPLRFVFDDAGPASINPEWLERLAATANSGEVTLVPEHSGPLTIPGTDGGGQ